MTRREEPDIVDRIYEAAAIPDMWPGVLDAVSDIAGGVGGLLFASDGAGFRSVGSRSLDGVIERYVSGGWPARDDRTVRLFASRHAGFLTDLDVYAPAEIESLPLYREFLRPNGLGWGVATAVSVPSGERIAFDVERAHAEGPVPREAVVRLDALRPHLARAATLAARLGLRTARAAAQALDTIGLPAVVLGPALRPVAMNEGAEALLRDGVIREGARLVLGDQAADRLLSCALASLGATGACVRSIPLRATPDTPPMVLHVLPVRRAAHDLFGAAAAIAAFTPLAAGADLDVSVLEGLFDLTGAEARVARGIAARRSVEEIASDAGLSRETVRTQLKAVLSKTGTRRQAELAAMLAAAAPPGLAR